MIYTLLNPQSRWDPIGDWGAASEASFFPKVKKNSKNSQSSSSIASFLTGLFFINFFEHSFFYECSFINISFISYWDKRFTKLVQVKY